METPCGTYVFLFARVGLLDKGVTRFFGGMTVFGAVSWGSVMVESVVDVVRVVAPERFRQQRPLFTAPWNAKRVKVRLHGLGKLLMVSCRWVAAHDRDEEERCQLLQRYSRRFSGGQDRHPRVLDSWNRASSTASTQRAS